MSKGQAVKQGGADQQKQPNEFKVDTNEHNSIKRVIGVVSGKGGVGKSLVTSMLAIQMSRKGYQVGILDADITGPSIPKMFGLTKKAVANKLGILPEMTTNNTRVISINLMLEQADSPVIWRGPMISGVVKQFWTDVIWGELDYLFVDMPPGTGDVPLTVYQSLPIDGIIIVSSPQDLVNLIVRKAYNMAKSMDVPVLGIVENMSYIECPDCGKKIELFGESHIDQIAGELQLNVLGKLPLDPAISKLCDAGRLEHMEEKHLLEAAGFMEKQFS